MQIGRTYSINPMTEDDNDNLVVEGRIGIGTAKPDLNVTLDVVGNVKMSGHLIRTGYVVGDVNGDWVINGDDIIYLARNLAAWPGYDLKGSGDINRDGKVTDGDITYLARALAKWRDYNLPPDSIPYASYAGYVTGDVDGNYCVDTNDIIYLARNLAAWPGYDLKGSGDINQDGKVTYGDITYLARALAKWPGYNLPVESLPYAQYSKFDVTGTTGYAAEFVGGAGIKVDGNLTIVNGTVEAGGGLPNHAICWKTDGKTLGYCSGVIADGVCATCN